VLKCQRRNGRTQVIEGGVGHDDQGLGRLVRKSGKGGVEFSRALELDEANCHAVTVCRVGGVEQYSNNSDRRKSTATLIAGKVPRRISTNLGITS
jgi:hypothetical protein